ncbi:hypothetical protein NCC49_001717 [Naganishia albida]|nr:hypothetical protein NCC49_001717 [Naganishia albida]
MPRRGTGLAATTAQFTSTSGYRAVGKHHRRPPDGSWATMDPDEVFRRLNVAEVKKVEAQLRASAGGKQAELRAMVSERYRDLLQSTTQIATIHDSSLKLSRALERIEVLCSDPARRLTPDAHNLNAAVEGKDDALVIKSPNEHRHPTSLGNKPEASAETDGNAITEQLPAAAAVKFLIDAPEAMYRFLSARAYLQAAFLWLLSRTVKEYMLSSSEDSVEEENNKVYAPLVQKQWETLVPLRAQVVHKATASMRDLKRLLKPGQEQDRITFVQTLLAIMLLDSNTSLDALTLFLDQRTRSIEDIFTASQFIRPNVSFVRDSTNNNTNSATTPIDRPKSRHTRQASRLDAAQILRELSPAPPGAKDAMSPSGTSETQKPNRKDIKRKMIRDRASKALSDTIKCIASTVGMSKSSCLSRPEADFSSSLLDEAIDRIQRGERKASIAQRSPVSRQTSMTEGQRRTSRLPSMLPIITDQNPGQTPFTSTSTILKTLPSSQMLVTYLPERVQMFAPFITPVSCKSKSEQERQVVDKLDSWVSDAITALAPRIDIWLSRLDNISDVWKIRTHLLRLLDEIKSNETIALSSEQVDAIRKVAQTAFETRTKAIWRAQLDQLLEDTRSGLMQSLEKIRSNDTSSMTDLHPSLMYFSSPMHFPSVSMGAFTSGTSQQADFISAELPRFQADLRTRILHRTHLLQERLLTVEAGLAQLQHDASALNKHRQGHALVEVYRRDLTSALSSLIDVLEDTLRATRENATNDPISVDLAMFIGRFALHVGTLPVLEGKGSLEVDITRDIQAKLQQVYTQSVTPWKTRTVEDAMQIFKKAFEPQSSVIPDLSACIFNAFADMVAAILDSGAIQPQRMPLQKELAFDFANQAISVWHDSGFDESAEQGRCMALLAFIAGTATAQQVESAIPYIKRVQLLLQPLLEHTLPSVSAIVPTARSASENRQAILLPFGQAPISNDYVSPTPVMKPSARFAMLSLV